MKPPLPALNNSISNVFFPFQGSDRFGTIEGQFQELRAWLTTKISWFEQLQLSKGQLPMDFDEFTRFKAEMAQKRDTFNRLSHLQQTNKNIGIAPEAWNEVDTNWQKVESQVSRPI